MNLHNITIQYSHSASFAVPVTRTAFRRERKLQRNSSHPNTRGHAQPVRLEFFDSQAHEVNIAGSFNDWRPGATWMISLGDGCWVKELQLPPGRYEYCCVVDGNWMPDPKARCPNTKTRTVPQAEPAKPLSSAWYSHGVNTP